MSDGVNLGPAKVVRATEKALLVLLDGEEEAWVPKSVIHDDSEVYSEKANEGDLIVAGWWAKNNGFGD
jgi:hypothetical protein